MMKSFLSLALVLAPNAAFAPSAAFAQSNVSAGVLNVIEQRGTARVQSAQSTLLVLKSSGIYCPKDPAVVHRALKDQSLPNLLAGTTCSVEEHLADSRVVVSQIVDARVLYLHEADLAELTRHFATQPLLASINWRFEKVARMDMDSPLMRYSYEIAARNPLAELAQKGL